MVENESSTSRAGAEGTRDKSPAHRRSIVVRFAGDSGDGIQLAGTQLTNTSALFGNDVSTLPDFPAEIRAPRGTTAGVSGFQIQFAAHDVLTPGEQVDLLVAMNPAALIANLDAVAVQATIIVDEEAFDARGLKAAKIESNPLEDGTLDNFQVLRVPMTRLTQEAVSETGLGRKLAQRCRNFFALGLVYWVYERTLETTEKFIADKYPPTVAEANRLALRAGWAYGETIEALQRRYCVPTARLPSGAYRNVTGNEALALGLITAARRSGKDLFYAAYPITPASDILHRLSSHARLGVRTFQAEDEIASMSAAIGAAFGGAMAATGSSGPGIALKAEALGLAVMLELPMIVIDVQRAGPSTGMPTKPEQSDLLQAIFGRSGEAPMPVLAAASPGDCFWTVLEAWQVATTLMTPVFVLSDAYVANGAEPWRIPDFAELPAISISHPGPEDAEDFLPYARDQLGARPWALPGTSGLMHRIGGLEKQDGSGEICYTPENHAHMVSRRAHKIENAARLASPSEVFGPHRGRLLVLSWGGTFGACREAVIEARKNDLDVAHLHLRYLNPLPKYIENILRNYDHVLVPELNSGQLRFLLGARYGIVPEGYGEPTGQPLSVTGIVERIQKTLQV